MLLLVSVLFALLHKDIVKMMPFIVGKIYGCTLVPYCWMFLLGAFLSEKKEFCLEILKKYWWMFLVIAVIIRLCKIDCNVVLYGLFYSIFSFCGFLGFAYRFPRWNLKVDVSYAVYVYHMVVVNVFIALGLVNNIWYMLLVFAITFVLSFVSTKTLGAFGLKKKLAISIR